MEQNSEAIEALRRKAISRMVSFSSREEIVTSFRHMLYFYSQSEHCLSLDIRQRRLIVLLCDISYKIIKLWYPRHNEKKLPQTATKLSDLSKEVVSDIVFASEYEDIHLIMNHLYVNCETVEAFSFLNPSEKSLYFSTCEIINDLLRIAYLDAVSLDY